LYGNKGNYESFRGVKWLYHFTGSRSNLMEASSRASSLRDIKSVIARIQDYVARAPDKKATAMALHSIFRGLGLVVPGT